MAPIVIVSETQHGAIFEGGVEAIHLIDCSHLVLDGFRIRQQTGNGINIDDGGDYSTPAHHIQVRNCLFEDIDNVGGNNDFLKLSGLDSFYVQNCAFYNGAAGSGIDMVGCHYGIIENCYFEDALPGIQAKGGSRFVTIRRNVFNDIDQRAINIGGSTGLEFFEAAASQSDRGCFRGGRYQCFLQCLYRLLVADRLRGLRAGEGSQQHAVQARKLGTAHPG